MPLFPIYLVGKQLKMLTYIIIFFLSLLSFAYYYFTRTFNYWEVRNVASVTPVPFFGNMKKSALRRINQGVVIKDIYDKFPNEKVVGVYRMTTPALLVRDLDLIKYVMIKDFDAFLDRGVEFSKEGLGANLFHADGETWQVLRNRFTPLFTSGKLKNMFYLMTERGDKFVEYVSSITNQNPEQQVHALVQIYTMSTISACAFGLDIDLHEDKMAELRKINDQIFNLNFANELDMMYPGILKTFGSSLVPKSVSQFFNNLVETVIKQRNNKPSNRKDFMDLILELRQQGDIYGNKRSNNESIHLELTDSVIAAQAFVFYAAGYETSATTMSFMLYQLALNPDVQDKLIAEIDEVLHRHNGEVTYDSLKEMTYMTQVFDETLRMYPLVEPLQRRAKVDYKFPGTDVTVKKGQTVLISPIGIQHDVQYYPNPEKFDPDRFTPENSRDRHPCAYIPFGTGPRNCIGMRFAKVQSRICIAKLLSKFRVEPSINTKKVMDFNPSTPIISPKGGIYLNIVPRK